MQTPLYTTYTRIGIGGKSDNYASAALVAIGNQSLQIQ